MPMTCSAYYAPIACWTALNRRVEALIAVKLRPHSRTVIDGFRRFVIDLPETLALYVTAGESDVFTSTCAITS